MSQKIIHSLDINLLEIIVTFIIYFEGWSTQDFSTISTELRRRTSKRDLSSIWSSELKTTGRMWTSITPWELLDPTPAFPLKLTSMPNMFDLNNVAFYSLIFIISPPKNDWYGHEIIWRCHRKRVKK